MPLRRESVPVLLRLAGAKDLADYSRADALKCIDYLIANVMAETSVRRVISSIRAVMNFSISNMFLISKTRLWACAKIVLMG